MTRKDGKNLRQDAPLTEDEIESIILEAESDNAFSQTGFEFFDPDTSLGQFADLMPDRIKRSRRRAS